MSWSAQAKVNGEMTRDQVAEVIMHVVVTGNEQALAERDEQVERAKSCVLGILLEGCVGKGNGKSFNVSMSGHANVGHEPNAEWANDYMTISVYQEAPKPNA